MFRHQSGTILMSKSGPLLDPVGISIVRSCTRTCQAYSRVPGSKREGMVSSRAHEEPIESCFVRDAFRSTTGCRRSAVHPRRLQQGSYAGAAEEAADLR